MSNPLEQGDVMDLAAIRERLNEVRGPVYWRSLEELAETPAFQEFLHREFPGQATEWLDPTSRRNFLRLMGASLALAGVSGCAHQPPEDIVPYVRSPEQIVPGKPLFFATALPLGGYATGVLVESHMGRPTKVEGNPAHPNSLGATDVFAQGEVLGLYDPDRSQVVIRNARVSTWGELQATLVGRVQTRLRLAQGAGLRVLTGATTSPTLVRLLDELTKALPEARWHVHEPAGCDQARAGAKLAFGEPVEPILRVGKADVIVSLGSDFLYRGPGRLAASRQFAERREPGEDRTAINRLYVAEHGLTVTGSMADHRLPIPARRVADLARTLAQRLGVPGAPAPAAKPADLGPDAERWIAAVVRDLKAHNGASLVLAGDEQPPEVHALAHVLNQALGNVGKTVEFIDPVEAGTDGRAGTLAELVRDMRAGKVDTLLILDSNPAYTAPADLNFAKAIDDVKVSIHLGLYEDETAELCNWHVPAAHPLESWGDLRAFDGTASIQQPLIAPLYGGKTPYDILAVLLATLCDQPVLTTLDLVRETWKARHTDDFESFWRRSVHDGVIAGTATEPRSVASKSAGEIAWPKPGTAAEGLEIVFAPDPTVYDGRYANNGWLQELPKPLNKLTWDNALFVSPDTAKSRGLSTMDLVEIQYGGRKLKAAVWVAPGHADGSVTLHLGYGRRKAGRVGTADGAANGGGFNAYALRTSDAPWIGTGITLRKLGGTYPLASTQMHWSMEGRNLVREVTIGEFLKDPHLIREMGHEPAPDMQIFERPEPQRVRQEDGVGNRWAMAINLNTCIGCGACVIACQAENNIPVVGKDQILRNREMQWLRVDHYFKDDPSNPKVYHQPVPCMQCETAPCELVCPVAATAHSAEGLNDMVYNRCVGTRYCSNNCPYKVRRFNFLEYSDLITPSLKLMRNPDVTVRTRGVMEKCNYCVQRINHARIEIEKAAASHPGGAEPHVPSKAVVTACQQVCPTQAIVFGNLNDPSPDNAVAKLKASPRNYGLLEGLNTRPRTTYLARLTNPHPDLAKTTNPNPESEAD